MVAAAVNGDPESSRVVWLLGEPRELEIPWTLLRPVEITHRGERRADQETELRAVRVDVDLDRDVRRDFMRSEAS
jgi:hypothetical protein